MSKPENKNRNAFPVIGGKDRPIIANGLNKLEFFTVLALQGLLANPEIGNLTGSEDTAKTAIVYAEAALKLLENRK